MTGALRRSKLLKGWLALILYRGIRIGYKLVAVPPLFFSLLEKPQNRLHQPFDERFKVPLTFTVPLIVPSSPRTTASLCKEITTKQALRGDVTQTMAKYRGVMASM